MNLYLEPPFFDGEYILEREMTVNDRTKVYSTEKEAIKISTSDWALSDICYLSQFKHPNLIALLNYTLENIEDDILVKYAMPLGQDIKSIYSHQEELFDLIYDMTSALKYLNNLGYVYADLKPSNIVRFEATKNERSKYVLIDMGFVRPYCTTQEGKFFTGIAYTLPYRDFQFDKKYNEISCEIYSLGQTIRAILNNCKNIFLSTITKDEIITNMNKNFPNISTSLNHKKLFFLIQQMICKPAERITFNEILEHSLLKNCKLLINKNQTPNVTPMKIFKSKITITQKTWYSSVYIFCFQLYVYFNLDIRGLFLIIHNVKRCLHLCDEKNILSYFIVNAYIISTILHNSNYAYSYIIEELNDYFNDNFMEILVKVMTTLEGQYITKTEWDSCLTEKEILLAFSKSLIFDTIITRFSKQLIDIVYPKKKQISLICSYEKFVSNLDIDINYKSVLHHIKNESFNLKNDSNIWISKINNLKNSDIKSLFKDSTSVENCGLLFYWDYELLGNSDLGNFFIFNLIKYIKSLNIERYSYFINIVLLKQLYEKNQLQQLAEKNNLYLYLRNSDNSPIMTYITANL
jgi:serine/threonine protein kinase